MHVHVVPLRILVATWAALLVLTVITVAAAKVNLGSLNIVVALGIAVLKSSVVALYFMHLRYDRPFHAIAFIVALLFVFLFITFALIDTQHYRPELIPGYAPAIDEARSAAHH